MVEIQVSMVHSIKNNMSTEDRWDKIYERTRLYYDLYLYQAQLLDIIKSQFETLDKKEILEVGCGKGNELIQLAREGAHCVGLDYSRAAIDLLKVRISKEGIPITLVQGDARSLPFKENSFDLIFSQGVLEHFVNPSLLLNEQWRCLRGNGIIVVEVPNKWTLYTVYKKILMLIDQWPAGWETQFSPREMHNLMEENGFVVIDRVGWDFLFFKIIRKIKRKMGFHQKSENKMVGLIRQFLQRQPVLLYLFSSLIVVGRKK